LFDCEHFKFQFQLLSFVFHNLYLIEYTNNFLGNQTVPVNREQSSVSSDRGWILDE